MSADVDRYFATPQEGRCVKSIVPVLSPFAGIGSEGVVALEEGRRFIGIELKPSYYGQAKRNLAAAEQHKASDLFADEIA